MGERKDLPTYVNKHSLLGLMPFVVSTLVEALVGVLALCVESEVSTTTADLQALTLQVQSSGLTLVPVTPHVEIEA